MIKSFNLILTRKSAEVSNSLAIWTLLRKFMAKPIVHPFMKAVFSTGLNILLWNVMPKLILYLFLKFKVTCSNDIPENKNKKSLSKLRIVLL